jgi:hypothetical protein
VSDRTVEIFHRLRMLRALAFLFARTRDASGAVIALVGIRLHHGVIDVLQIYSEDDADAIRMPSAGLDGRDGSSVLWSASGAPDEVIDAVLGLPDPDAHLSNSVFRNGNSFPSRSQ